MKIIKKLIYKPNLLSSIPKESDYAYKCSNEYGTILIIKNISSNKLSINHIKNLEVIKLYKSNKNFIILFEKYASKRETILILNSLSEMGIKSESKECNIYNFSNRIVNILKIFGYCINVKNIKKKFNYY